MRRTRPALDRASDVRRPTTAVRDPGHRASVVERRTGGKGADAADEPRTESCPNQITRAERKRGLS